MTRPGTIWFRRAPRDPEGVLLALCSGRRDERGAGDTRDELVPVSTVPALLADPLVSGVAEVVERAGRPRVLRLHTRRPPALGPAQGPGATPPPDLWFVLRDDSSPDVPALVLDVHASAAFTPGAVLGRAQLGAHGADPAVASLRWLVGSGAVHQVRVAPTRRRTGLALRLLVAADLLCAAHGWPPLHGGAERTAAGDALLAALPKAWGRRLDPLERLVELPGA